ncbi:hypothetical protein ACFQH6_16205 [Halobacteriaceae archaeon GCM10025711]
MSDPAPDGQTPGVPSDDSGHGTTLALERRRASGHRTRHRERQPRTD